MQGFTQKGRALEILSLPLPKKFENYDVVIASTATYMYNRVYNVTHTYLCTLPSSIRTSAALGIICEQESEHVAVLDR